jgi:tryptophan 7-halogenase
MSGAPAMGSVAVAGGGLTAWSAAAALKRRIPSLDVTVVTMAVPPNALADRMISTLPSIHGFHRDIGLTDEDTIVRARSGARLGTLFDGWVEGLPDYVHAYDPYGAPIEGISFHQLWLRERREAALPPFDRYSPAAEMARSGKPPNRTDDTFEFGLQLSLPLYGEMMHAYALHLGVAERRGPIAEVELRASGNGIERLVMDDGGSVSADLFVDCTGPQALIRSRLKSDFTDWSQWLRCDRLIMADAAPAADLEVMDRATTASFGWQWRASSPERTSIGLAYSSAHVPEETLARELVPLGIAAASDAVALHQGRWGDLWSGNCVAVGDAAVAVEPLEWTNLHLAHSQIDRIIAMMPGKDCAPVELGEFNRQCAAEADRVRDFLCLHYVCSRRPEPFWKEAASVAPPDSLAHTLSQFAERGRLPFHEEETFARDSWLAVMLGQGFEPRHTDPLADLVTPARARQALKTMRHSLDRPSPAIRTESLIDLNPRGAR